MGITGLLPFLEPASRTCHVSEFRDATVAVDTYCWLHRGANACAVQLARGEETEIYVNYCLKYVKMLQHYNIRPILVFDGKNLPAKSETEAKRRESRNKAKQRAAELLRMGKTDEARTYLKQSINITPNMASEVIKECHKINVDCIVAPYESDAQLAFFNLKGIAEVVITEDSDLVLFGCSKVIFKLDLQGCGSLVEADKIPQAMKLRPDRYTFDKFRYMCILSGCDYMDSLRGIGLKKAQKFMSLTEETNPEIFLTKLPRYLNMRHLQITNEYKENFMVANATFRHQTVFDPFKKKLVPLTDPAVTGTNPKHCKNAGEIFDHEKAYQVALGNLHPTTFEQLDTWSPNENGSSSDSIWSGVYKKSISRKEQKRQFKEYFVQSNIKVKAMTEKDEEQIKIEEDIQIDKELQFYTRKSLEPQKASTSEIKDEIVESPKKEPTSPVLKRNPFIVKKLSKFQFTNSDSQIIVKSRYFNSESDSVEEKMEVNMECMDLQYTQLSDVENMENLPHNPITEIETDLVIDENKITASDSTKRHCDVINLVDETHTDSDETENIEKATEKLEISFTTKSIGETSNTKRKKLGPCRSVGLKRSKSESNGGQQTIQKFFEQFKKK